MTTKIVTDSVADLPSQVVEHLGSRFPKEHVHRSKTTPAMGTHTGPGLLLVAVLGDKG